MNFVYTFAMSFITLLKKQITNVDAFKEIKQSYQSNKKINLKKKNFL